jgi:hypothetical protein
MGAIGEAICTLAGHLTAVGLSGRSIVRVPTLEAGLFGSWAT